MPGARSPLFSRKQAGGLFVVANEADTPGDIFFAGSAVAAASDTANEGRNPDAPLATLDAAVNECTAGQGDTIYLLPGHTENVIEAGAIDLDVKGISVIGLGNGSLKPTFTFTTADTADIDIDAADITMRNIAFVCDIDGLAAPIDVNAAGFVNEDCTFTDLGTDNTVTWILATAAADQMRISRAVNRGTATAGNTAFITLTGPDGVVIEDCRSDGDFDGANVLVLTTAVTDALITRNHLENANAVDVNIEGVANSTGWISFNSCRIATDAQTTWINTAGNMGLFENYGVNNNGETGLLIGTPSG